MLGRLPLDIVKLIFTALSPRDLAQAVRLNKALGTVAACDRVWKAQYSKAFGELATADHPLISGERVGRLLSMFKAHGVLRGGGGDGEEEEDERANGEEDEEQSLAAADQFSALLHSSFKARFARRHGLESRWLKRSDECVRVSFRGHAVRANNTTRTHTAF
jgi:hypothetical protein